MALVEGFRGDVLVSLRLEAGQPVDLHIAGCPPSPNQLLEGLLTLLEASLEASSK